MPVEEHDHDARASEIESFGNVQEHSSFAKRDVFPQHSPRLGFMPFPFSNRDVKKRLVRVRHDPIIGKRRCAKFHER